MSQNEAQRPTLPPPRDEIYLDADVVGVCGKGIDQPDGSEVPSVCGTAAKSKIARGVFDPLKGCAIAWQ